MGCCGCGHKTWTRTIIGFTIIFCLLHIGGQLFIVNPDLIQGYSNAILDSVIKYLKSINFAFSLSITSLILDVLWIISCIPVLVYVSHKEIKKPLVISYILWDIAAILSFIVDIISCSMYVGDYEKDMTSVLFMEIISSRYVIGLIFNIFAIIGMIIITNLSRRKMNKSPKKKIVPLKPPKPVLKKPIRETHLEENNIDRVRDWHNHYENSNGFQQNYTNGPNYIPRLSEIPRSNESLSISSHNTDSGLNPALPGSNTNIYVNGVPSGTLRRQLPWTYMPNPNELPHMQPRKLPVTPYIPAPDYSLKNPKPISRRDFHEPGWSQHL